MPLTIDTKKSIVRCTTKFHVDMSMSMCQEAEANLAFEIEAHPYLPHFEGHIVMTLAS